MKIGIRIFLRAKHRVLLLMAISLLWVVEAGSQHAFSSVHFHPRTGWPHVAKLLHKGLPVRIAYFGGSITEAKGGWREQTLALLQKAYPQTLFTHVNASIGGTGSDLGVFRVERDVLRHLPDLVLIEFAVNDNGKDKKAIQQGMEGIVTKIKAYNPAIDIAFVYTVENKMVMQLMEGQLPASIDAMEELAVHYRIPTVLLGAKVLERYREGRLVLAGPQPFSGDTLFFSSDNVHPYAETGHKLYSESFMEAVPDMLENTRTSSSHPKVSLTANPFKQAAILPVTQLAANSKWNLLTASKDSIFQRFTYRMDTLLQGFGDATAIRFKFTGTRFGLYDVIGPGTGAYVINIDGRDTTIRRFDRFCFFWRMHYFLLPELADGPHQVTIRVATQSLDKETILCRPIIKEEREKYLPTACYPAALLLVGKLESE